MGQLNRNNRKKYSSNKETKINISLSSDMLAEIFFYSTYQSKLITKRALRNAQLLMNCINERKYETKNVDMYNFILIIREILRLRLDENMSKLEFIIESLKDKFPEIDDIKETYFDSYFNEDIAYEDIMTSDEILYIGKYIENKLTYKQIYEAKDLLMPIFNKIDSDENVSLEILNTEFMGIIENIFSNCMQFKADSEHVMDDFDLYDIDSTDFVLQNTVDEYSKPNNKLKTGLQELNKILDGGLENGRFYNICAVPKGWKSGFLLNVAIWGVKYNQKFDLKNPNKIPTVFYLTMENSVRETINRLYVNLTGKSIKYYSFEKARKILYDEIKEKYNVNLVIKYRRPKSISTLDFNSMIDEIESENKEVILAILDYTKRIKSSSPNSELRIELATIADDLCSIAKTRNIPIVSASQLNRVAYQAVENAVAKGKKDIIKELNTSHIGESVGLIENPDVVLFINKEYEELTDESWLSIKMVASRVETEQEAGGYSFVQKFENGMKLEEDCDLAESLAKKSLGSNLTKNFDPNKTRNKIERKNNQQKNNVEEDKTISAKNRLMGRNQEKPTPSISSLLNNKPYKGSLFEEEDDYEDSDDTGLYEDYEDDNDDEIMDDDIIKLVGENVEVEVEEFTPNKE